MMYNQMNQMMANQQGGGMPVINPHLAQLRQTANPFQAMAAMQKMQNQPQQAAGAGGMMGYGSFPVHQQNPAALMKAGLSQSWLQAQGVWNAGSSGGGSG